MSMNQANKVSSVSQAGLYENLEGNQNNIDYEQDQMGDDEFFEDSELEMQIVLERYFLFLYY